MREADKCGGASETTNFAFGIFLVSLARMRVFTAWSQSYARVSRLRQSTSASSCVAYLEGKDSLAALHVSLSTCLDIWIRVLSVIESPLSEYLQPREADVASNPPAIASAYSR